MTTRRRLMVRLRSAASVAGSLYLAIQLCMAAWVAVPAVALGWAPEVALDGAMAPSLGPGDVVLVDRRPAVAVGVGDLVVVDGRVRRVAKVAADGTFRTKGDAEGRVGRARHEAAAVEGVGRLLIPAVGAPVLWWATGRTVPFVAWASSIVLAVVVARRPGAWTRSRPDRRTVLAGVTP